MIGSYKLYPHNFILEAPLTNHIPYIAPKIMRVRAHLKALREAQIKRCHLNKIEALRSSKEILLATR